MKELPPVNPEDMINAEDIYGTEVTSYTPEPKMLYEDTGTEPEELESTIEVQREYTMELRWFDVSVNPHFDNLKSTLQQRVIEYTVESFSNGESRVVKREDIWVNVPTVRPTF